MFLRFLHNNCPKSCSRINTIISNEINEAEMCQTAFMRMGKVQCLCVSCLCTAVVYDGCPKAFNAGIWWPRTSFGRPVAMNCPKGSVGECCRHVLQESGCWISKSHTHTVYTGIFMTHVHMHKGCHNKFHCSNSTINTLTASPK